MTSGAGRSPVLISAVDIAKTRQLGKLRQRILDSITFHIGEGDRVSVVGPNGSGKTTLLRILLGVEPPDSGQVLPAAPFNSIRMAYVPQDYRNAFYPWLSVRRNLLLPFEVDGAGRALADLLQDYEQRSRAYRISVDLGKYPYQLSGGEQQVILLLRSLMSDPQILILDEPLSAVDQGRRPLIHADLLNTLNSAATSVLLATHDIAEAVLLADRVIVLDQASPRVRTVIDVPLGWPRSPEVRSRAAFGDLVARVSGELM